MSLETPVIPRRRYRMLKQAFAAIAVVGLSALGLMVLNVIFFNGSWFTVVVSTKSVFHLSEKEQKRLIAKADAGDAQAAHRMWGYHAMSSGNRKEEINWLDRAAQLGHTDAQRWLAHMIVTYDNPYQTFGETPRDAVFKLLTDASKTDGTAACDLGERYYEGYFGESDRYARARQAFRLAATLHSVSSWEHLAKMLYSGEGGEADQVEAYYYICLDTRCTHPKSVGGEKLWDLRRKIEEMLSLDQAREVWGRVDAYITKERMRSDGRIYPPPFLGTAIPESQWNEYLKTADEFEARHRKSMSEGRQNR